MDLLVPIGIDMAAHIERAAAATAPLNIADRAFMDLCRLLLDSPRSGLVVGNATRFRLEMVLRGWRLASDSGSNLIGCDFAQTFALELAKSCDLGQLVGIPEVAERFKSVPSALKEFVRVNFFLPFQDVSALLDALLVDGGEILQWVNRVEISAWPSGMDETLCPPFPTLMLYVGLDEPRPTLENLLRVLAICRTAAATTEITSPSKNLSEFALPWLPFANLTQGYKLYKRYLLVLGVLDDVFDPETNHALVHPHQASDIAFCTAVRSATPNF